MSTDMGFALNGHGFCKSLALGLKRNWRDFKIFLLIKISAIFASFVDVIQNLDLNLLFSSKKSKVRRNNVFIISQNHTNKIKDRFD